MSHQVDEYYRYYRETERKARKEHTCSACDETIQKGHKYYSIAWLFDGTVGSVKRCRRCQTVHEHLRDLSSGFEDTWPAEDLNCGQDYEDEWGELPPEIAKLAFVTQSEMQ